MPALAEGIRHRGRSHHLYRPHQHHGEFSAGKLLQKTPDRVVFNLPDLDFIPYERGKVNERDKKVAIHELQHALPAYVLGIRVIEASIDKREDSEGRTILEGGHSDFAYQVVAMGSSVHKLGCPEGTGSDRHKAHALSFRTKRSAVSAKAEAEKALSHFSPQVLNKLAEMLAYKGKIDGSMLNRLIRRAEAELLFEGKDIEHVNVEEFKPKEEIKQVDEHVIIDDLPHDFVRIRVMDNNNMKKEEFICKICEEVNGSHNPRKHDEYNREHPNSVKEHVFTLASVKKSIRN